MSPQFLFKKEFKEASLMSLLELLEKFEIPDAAISKMYARHTFTSKQESSLYKKLMWYVLRFLAKRGHKSYQLHTNAYGMDIIYIMYHGKPILYFGRKRQ